MKTKLFTLCLAALLISSLSFATIRRVGYNGITREGVDYTNFNAANDASSNGDTLQIYGNQSGRINKRLVVIGFGYNFDVHTNLQAIATDAPSDINLDFQNGSQNSILEGCSGSFTLRVSSITIKRSKGSINLYNLDSSINNTKVLSCVIHSISMNWQDRHACINTQIYNSIIYSANFYDAGSTGSIINCVTASPNYSGGSLNLTDGGFLVKNCIIANYNANSINTVFENNFFGSNQPATLPSGSNNRWGQDWSSLFNRIGGSDDAVGYLYGQKFDENYYILKSGSPAKNGGIDAANEATDAGIYGGELAYRYKLSGVPAVPAIYKLTAPNSAASSNPYNVTISVRSNN